MALEMALSGLTLLGLGLGEGDAALLGDILGWALGSGEDSSDGEGDGTLMRESLGWALDSGDGSSDGEGDGTLLRGSLGWALGFEDGSSDGVSRTKSPFLM